MWSGESAIQTSVSQAILAANLRKVLLSRKAVIKIMSALHFSVNFFSYNKRTLEIMPEL